MSTTIQQYVNIFKHIYTHVKRFNILVKNINNKKSNSNLSINAVS